MKKTYKILYRDNFVIIKNISLKSIQGLPKKEVENLYNKYGAILFRDFNINIHELKNYTDLYSLNYANDANRRLKVSNSRYIKGVDEGNKMMPLHSEASYSSSWPDIIWFYCVKPALKSGYTTLCDGKSVYENLKLETKKFFLENPISYHVEIPVEIRSNKSNKIRNWHFDEIGCVNPVLNEKEKKISFIQNRYAVNKIQGLEKICFSNHLQIYLNRDSQLKKWTIKNKRNLPKLIIKDVKKVCKKFTYEIFWKQRDLCMINNKRYMHGRTEIKKSDRKLRKIVNIQTLNSSIGRAI